MIRRYRKSFDLCLKASTLLVGLTSGYGRAWAGSYTGTAGTYFCLGPAAPGIDTTISLAGNPLTVTTATDFGITVTSGDAFNLSSTGGLSFTDNAMSAITGAEDGIVASNLGGGGLTITTSGMVVGVSGIGIWANNAVGGGDLTISAAGAQGGDDGINAFNLGSGHLMVTANGLVQGLFDNGIYANNSANGSGLTITATDLVNGGHNGIVATNNGNAGLSITTAFQVSGSTGIGVWANNSAYGGDLTISTEGQVFGGTEGINAVNAGNALQIATSGLVMGGANGIVASNNGDAGLTITTAGLVVGNGGIGIWATNSANGTGLTITADTAVGGNHGVMATNSGNSGLSIAVADMAQGASGMGIWGINSANGTDLTITAGNAIGGYAGIVGMNEGSGALTITASGPVQGGSGYGIYASNGSYGTDLSITGGSIAGGDTGVEAINHGSGSLSIAASGAVSGASDLGVHAVNDGTNLNISVADVSGTAIGINADNQGSGSLSINASGAITGLSAAGLLATNSGTDLNISGTDFIGGWIGIQALNNGTGALSIAASGSVIGANSGIFALNQGTSLSISANEAFGNTMGIFATNNGTGAVSISTSGAVMGTGGFGIAVMNNGSSPTTIDVGLDSVVQGIVSGIFVGSTLGLPVTINVAGQVRNISGQLASNAIIANNGPVTLNLLSSSAVTGNIQLGNWNDTVTLAGALTGSLQLQGGNDTFIQYNGARLTGTVDGGAGNDTLGFNNMGRVDGSLLGTTYLNFENLGIYGGLTTLTGTWDFAGGTATVFAGSLSLPGTLNAGAFDVGSGGFAKIGGTLNSGTVTVAGAMDVGGTVNTGSFTVADGGFAGITGTVNSETSTVYGIMNLNGNLTASPLTVAAGGLLSGSGHVSGSLINYGAISPGNSIGTLSVDGSASFMPGSSYLVELRSDGASDRLAVDGSVVLDGGTVQTNLPRGLYANGRSWKIISATGSVNGAFDRLSYRDRSETVDLQLAYAGNRVMLEVVRTSFASFGFTPAGQSVGHGLDEVVSLAGGDMAGFITAMDFDMSRSEIENTLEALSPEMYTSFPAAGLHDAEVFDQAAGQHQAEFRQDRMLGLIAPADEDAVDPGNWIVWTKGLGNWSEQDADQGYQGYSQNTGGVAIGADRQILSGVRVGLDLGYTDSDLEWEDTADSGSLQGRHLGLYASADAGNFFADAVVGYADFGNEAERVIAFGGYRTVAKGSFDASVWTGRLTGGYNFPVGSWLLGPVASLGYGHLAQDGFSESGAGFLGLDIADAEADSLISNLGLRLAGRIAGKQWQYVPRLELLWQHQFEDEGAAVTANFVNYRTASFEVTGIAPAADQGTATMGLSVDYGRNLSLYVDYGVALADGYTSQLVSGGLSWRF